MRQVAKYACPLFVVLGLLIFHANDSRYVLPITIELVALATIFLACKPLRDKPNSGAILLFWLAPLALLWLLSERREDRDVSTISIAIELGLAAIGTGIILAKNGLKKDDAKLVFAILLTWGVGYFSGSSGGADKMHPMFTFLGLTADEIIRLVIWIRKFVHLTFYGSLTWLFATYLWNRFENKTVLLAFAAGFPLSIASCDEFRQSFMPNRQGSVYDVMFDMSATLAVLLVLWRISKKSVVTSN